MEGGGKDSILAPILEEQVNQQRPATKNRSILSVYMCIFLTVWRLTGEMITWQEKKIQVSPNKTANGRTIPLSY